MKTLIITLSIYAFYAVVFAIFCVINWVKEELERHRLLKEILAHYNEELDRFEFAPLRIREEEQIKGIVPEHLQIKRKANIREWLKAMRLSGNCRVSCAYILSNVCIKCGSKVLAIYETGEYYDFVKLFCLGCENVMWFRCAVYKDPFFTDDIDDIDEKPTLVLIKCLAIIFVPIWAPIYIIYLIGKWFEKL